MSMPSRDIAWPLAPQLTSIVSTELRARLRQGFRIGAFTVEPLSGRIVGSSGVHHVQPKVMDVFVFLAQHAGEIVERDTLLEQVWRRFTSEEVLTRCISELRRVLCDDSANPTYIQTVPKRGYRLLKVAAVEQQSDEAVEPSSPSVSPPPTTSAMASVAVLPFDNLSPDPTHAFMGDAFAAELHSTLARVDRLRVASRRSSFVFKDAKIDIREIGRRLNVDHVISGSFQTDGSNLRIVAEMNDALTGTQLWAQSYDRKNDDLFAIERDIAGAIVGAFTTQQLRAEMQRARREPTTSLDAWGLVQKARSYVLDYTAQGLAGALEPLKRATELDPGYAAAHATLGAVLTEQLINGLSGNPQRDEIAARDAAAKALELGPEDPFVLKMVSLVSSYRAEHRHAVHCLRKAVALTPFDFGTWGYLGWPLTSTAEPADLSEARLILDRLLLMEPKHPGVAFWLYHRSVADACDGHYAASAELAERAIESRPNLSLAWMHYANVLGQQDLKDAARRALQRCKESNPAMTPQHFASLITRIVPQETAIEHRVGGLRKIGALRR